jgi:hypothetical protein
MESIDPQFVKELIWVIAKAVISVCLGLIVFRISHGPVLPFVCFAIFWLVMLAIRGIPSKNRAASGPTVLSGFCVLYTDLPVVANLILIVGKYGAISQFDNRQSEAIDFWLEAALKQADPFGKRIVLKTDAFVILLRAPLCASRS